MTQNRWRSKVLWAAIIAQVAAILSFMGFFQWLGITEQLVGDVTGGVLQLFVLFGVLNNPSDAENF